MTHKSELTSDFRSYADVTVKSGWRALGIIIGLIVLCIICTALKFFLGTVILGMAAIFGSLGFYILPANIAGVGTFFGKPVGNFVGGEGLLWRNPFYVIRNVSTRSFITPTPISKINDLSGNPIMAAMQGEWYVKNPSAAIFNIDKHVTEYVQDVFTYSIRKIISEYSYDGSSVDDDSVDEMFNLNDDDGISDVVYLRTSSEIINERLKQISQERLEKAGVIVLSANIIDLAYAPEIASEMLQVQQANAFLNARRKIVKGATGVAIDAISDIESQGKEKNISIEFDKNQKANLVSNLLVVLCGNTSAQPIISLSNETPKHGEQ
ncbi:SPFH domain-containing protein [Teredinibacter purpureus]|uniref:SPFH domain-containing protein n=1 Tax=Teredinibacter purpureus TaxID=2731756 RepID=UPI00069921CB|nr:SPFH domain-containing protein [Teredinibacter purpureus]